MIKWIAAMLVLVALLGVVFWKLSAGPRPPKVVVPTFDAGAKVQPPTIVAKRRQTDPNKPPPDAQPATAEEGVLDSQSEAFSDRLDVGIPDKFRASLARCDRRGFDPDAKITISYKLHIEAGEVSASNVQVAQSDLGDRGLETCMVQAVQAARWEAKDLPDFSEEQEIFIRIRSLDKYLSKDEQEAAKSEANELN